MSEIQVAGRYLMQQRGEQEKIVLADDGDFKFGITALLELKGGIDTAKSPPRIITRVFFIRISFSTAFFGQPVLFGTNCVVAIVSCNV